MMVNRLVAQNTIKVSEIQSGIYANRNLLLYKTKQQLRVRLFHQNYTEVNLMPSANIINFRVSATRNIAYALSSSNELYIFTLDTVPTHIILKGVYQYTQHNQSLVIQAMDTSLRLLPIPTLPCELTAVPSFGANQHKKYIGGGSKLFVCTSQNLSIYERGRVVLSLPPIDHIIGVYADKYVISVRENSLYALDVEEGMRYGPVRCKGNYRSSSLVRNVLVVVTNHDHTDYYTFYILSQSGLLITHSHTYEKGKADDYAILYEEEAVAHGMVEKKIVSKDVQWSVNHSQMETSSILFMLYKNKEKTEMIKMDHKKIMKHEHEESIVREKIERETNTQNETGLDSEIDRIIHATRSNSNTESIKESQEKYIQLLIDRKMKEVMTKFSKLERRVDNLEKTIHEVYKKIETSLENIDKEEINQQLKIIFNEATPQLEEYFTEVFKQVTKVMDQGILFFNLKIAKEAQIHENALNKIVKDTFRETEKVLHYSAQNPAKIEESLTKVQEAKEKWMNRTKECQSELQQKGKTFSEAKVFIRTNFDQIQKKKPYVFQKELQEKAKPKEKKISEETHSNLESQEIKNQEPIN